MNDQTLCVITLHQHELICDLMSALNYFYDDHFNTIAMRPATCRVLDEIKKRLDALDVCGVATTLNAVNMTPKSQQQTITTNQKTANQSHLQLLDLGIRRDQYIDDDDGEPLW